MVTMTNEAPDIGPGYPSGGEKIRPAWETCWQVLADHEWHKGARLAEQVAAVSDVTAKTVSNLLRQAAAKGLLEVELRFAGKVGGYRSKTNAIRANWYRRTS